MLYKRLEFISKNELKKKLIKTAEKELDKYFVSKKIAQISNTQQENSASNTQTASLSSQSQNTSMQVNSFLYCESSSSDESEVEMNVEDKSDGLACDEIFRGINQEFRKYREA
jgi:hypothetical protein